MYKSDLRQQNVLILILACKDAQLNDIFELVSDNREGSISNALMGR